MAWLMADGTTKLMGQNSLALPSPHHQPDIHRHSLTTIS
ncbi:suppressor of lin-12-like protein-related / sel-1 protein-related (ISS) [Corchorus olitorius]|uniref:Suppressor of lin-12-like protein-related / sel-1 protein-related (ISS) n=1 Tax=Corchorus olitorius TaxID=93759 RepID=A0A1R3JME6_9ROSI|nr:suppressor of lin-12-like protein-related / sel-1 protein-related (ISS) [Corchorus olitorius]